MILEFFSLPELAPVTVVSRLSSFSKDAVILRAHVTFIAKENKRSLVTIMRAEDSVQENIVET